VLTLLFRPRHRRVTERGVSLRDAIHDQDARVSPFIKRQRIDRLPLLR